MPSRAVVSTAALARRRLAPAGPLGRQLPLPPLALGRHRRRLRRPVLPPLKGAREEQPLVAEEEADDALLEEALAEVDEQRLALRRLHHSQFLRSCDTHRAPTAASRSDGFLSGAEVTWSAEVLG